MDDYAVAPPLTCGEHGPPDPICEACEESACAAELARCEADEDCSRLQRCLVSCPGSDPDCRAGCFRACAVPNELSSSLNHCRRAACRAECVQSGGLFDFLGQDGCDACVADKCLEEVDACLAHDGCAETETCWEACGVMGGPACRFGCRPDLSAESFYNAVDVCAEQCRSVCLPEPRLACAGDYDLPEPRELTIIDRSVWQFYVDGSSAEGVVVNACYDTDPSCEAPVATDISDAEGKTEHELDISPRFYAQPGFFGFYELTGEEIYPYLLAFDSPILFGRDYRATGVLAAGDIDLVAALAGLEAIEGRAHLAVEVRDCADFTAEGIELEIEPSSEEQIVYFKRVVPSPGLTATSTDGLAGIINAPPAVTVRITGRRDGEIVFDGNAHTRPNTLTYIRLDPVRRVRGR